MARCWDLWEKDRKSFYFECQCPKWMWDSGNDCYWVGHEAPFLPKDVATKELIWVFPSSLFLNTEKSAQKQQFSQASHHGLH